MSQSRRKEKLYATQSQDSQSNQIPAITKPPEKQGVDYKKIYNNKFIFIIIALCIFGIAIYMRIGLIHSQGLFEPDGFFYYSWVKAILNNHLVESQHISLSAAGTKGLGEAQGLPYIVILPYLLLQYINLTPIQVMRWVPVAFALMEMILAYLIVTRLSKSKLLGLLAMFFIAVSSGNVARTAALVFRGDSFVAVPLLIGLYLLIIGIECQDLKKSIALGIGMAIAISVSIIIWQGGSISAATLMLALGLLSVFAFITNRERLAKQTLIFTIACGLIGIFQEIYIILNAARWYTTLTGLGFVVVYIPLLMFSGLTYFILKYKTKGSLTLLNSRINRMAFVIILIIIGVASLSIIFSSQISGLTLGLAITSQPTNSSQLNASINYAVSSTTQELQKPSYSFLYSSFGLQLYLGPIGVLLFLLFSDSINKDNEELRLNKNLSEIHISVFIILLSYLIITAYLQYSAIRYNSLLSIPLAIFAAYAIYAFIKIGSRLYATSRKQAYAISILIFFISFVLLYWAYKQVSVGIQANQILFTILGIGSAVALIILLIDTILSARKNKLKLYKFAIVMFLIIALFAFTYGALESYSSAQADGINPAFLQAMTWMKNNTPSNSLVLALWPDGSVVEGWGNRTSYIDSVGGENGSRIYPFAQYLIANNSDTQYLYDIPNLNRNISKPNYLLVRYYFLEELQGLVEEGVPSQGTAAFNFEQLSPTKSEPINATANGFIFSNGAINVTMISQEASNTIENSAYISQAGSLNNNQQPLAHLIFYNASSGGYAINNYTSTGASNYSFMIIYSGRQISEGLLLTPDLYNSNLFKFLFLCNQAECSYNLPGQNATMDLVYENNDSKIFKINYT